MTARPDRLTIVFTDPIRNRPAAASYQTLIEVSPGRDFENIEPIDEKQLADLLPSFNAGLLAERDSFRDNLDSTTRQLETAHTQVESLADQLEQSQAEIARLTAEIESLRNPPNPFPYADWPGFRLAALSDPAVRRVAVGNSVLWPLLLMFLNELSTNPLRVNDIAGLWNMMESVVPVTSDEIARVNAIAEEKQVPFRLNADGQIGPA